MVLQLAQPVDKNSRTITDSTVLKQKIYSDATYDYYCLAIPGSALTSAVWQVIRMDSDGSITHADSNEYFDNLATSLVVVAALTFG